LLQSPSLQKAQSGMKKHVVCVSWIPTLAISRELLLTHAGCRVTSILGETGLRKLPEISEVDLLVLAHSVPRERKQWAITTFKQYSEAPVLSLLEPNQQKLPQADFGVEAMNPERVLQVVQEILSQN